MRQYEVTFIVDPVLSNEEVKATVQTYLDLLKEEGCEIVHTNEMGLRQLAYPINRKNTGHYFCIEFQPKNGAIIKTLELPFRRDERVLRFLAVKLDKYGVKYNEDRRSGKIAKAKKRVVKEEEPRRGRNDRRGSGPRKERRKPAPATEETPKPVEAVETAPVEKKDGES